MRRVLWRAALVCIAGCAVVATLRHVLGDTAIAAAAARLQFFQPGSYVPRASLEVVPCSWGQTFAAGLVFLMELAQELTARGLWWIPLCAVVVAVVWFVAAQLNNRRTPSVPLALLLSLQFAGAMFYVSSFRAPILRIQSAKAGTTTFTAFDPHCHTTHSNGLLMPQQQVDWHRAHGFDGLAFTDSNQLMADAELTALRAANPDMHLLNGCEYHGDAHLIILGARSPIPSTQFDVPGAIRAAKEQNALVFVAHPWSMRNYTASQLQTLGVDGFEAWNGIIWSRDLAELDRRNNLIGTTATDELSKSGSHCFTWTLLPRGLKDEANVIRALRLRKEAAAYTLSDDDTPAAYKERIHGLRSPSGLIHASRRAWRNLSRAQHLSAMLGFVAAICVLWGWGSGPRRTGYSPIGPQHAVGYLRRRRLPGRLLGMFLMLFAFAGSAAAALHAFGATWRGAAVHVPFSLTGWQAIVIWCLLDCGYLYGRRLWGRRA